METSQWVWFENQFTGFYVIGISFVNVFEGNELKNIWTEK